MIGAPTFGELSAYGFREDVENSGNIVLPGLPFLVAACVEVVALGLTLAVLNHVVDNGLLGEPDVELVEWVDDDEMMVKGVGPADKTMVMMNELTSTSTTSLEKSVSTDHSTVVVVVEEGGSSKR